MTGAQLFAFFNTEVDNAYTSYLDTTKANRFFNKAFINVMQSIYLNRLNNQNAFDEMSFLVATDRVFALNSATNSIFLGVHNLSITAITFVTTTTTITTSVPHGLLTGMRITIAGVVSSGTLAATLNGNTYVVTVTGASTFTISTAPTTPTGVYTSGGTITFPDLISDYYHYLWGKAKFTTLTAYTVLNSTNASPIKITVNKRSPLRTGDQIVIGGISGNTNANGTFFIRQVNDFNYYLYSDAKLLTPVAGNGAQTGIGTISRVTYNTIKFKRSDEKGTVLGAGTILTPQFQQTKLLLRVLPLTETCTEITMDYIKTLPVSIDVANTTIDFSNWFPEYFQYKIISEVGVLLGSSTRDGALIEIENEQIVNNP